MTDGLRNSHSRRRPDQAHTWPIYSSPNDDDDSKIFNPWNWSSDRAESCLRFAMSASTFFFVCVYSMCVMCLVGVFVCCPDARQNSRVNRTDSVLALMMYYLFVLYTIALKTRDMNLCAHAIESHGVTDRTPSGILLIGPNITCVCEYYADQLSGVE